MHHPRGFWPKEKALGWALASYVTSKGSRVLLWVCRRGASLTNRWKSSEDCLVMRFRTSTPERSLSLFEWKSTLCVLWIHQWMKELVDTLDKRNHQSWGVGFLGCVSCNLPYYAKVKKIGRKTGLENKGLKIMFVLSVRRNFCTVRKRC